MRIGILKCGQSPEPARATLGDYDDMMVTMLAGEGFTFDSYHVEAMQFPAAVDAAQGWLITGSRHAVYEPHPFIAPLIDFIQRAHDADVPMVGVCFGHQAIAQALGGRVEKHAGGWAVGPQDYDFGGATVVMNAWHQDQVTEAPASARVLAGNDFCRNAALVYGDRAFSVQAHPEFCDAFVAALIEHRSAGVPRDLVERAGARLGTADAGPVVERIAAFFRQPRQADRLRQQDRPEQADGPGQSDGSR